MRVAAILLPFLLVGLLVGCAQREATPYAERYTAALERYPGHVLTDDAPIQAFVAFFSHRNTASPEAARATAEALYAEALYFSDTLMTTERHDEAVSHLARMHGGTDTLDVDLLRQLSDGADVYLIWRMRASFKPLFNTVNSDTIGLTHLRFDADGRIVLHQDFWDSADGFYQHVPGLGGLIHAVGNRFASQHP